jgi:hypothetical protein
MKPNDIIEKLLKNPMYEAAMSSLKTEEEKTLITNNVKDMIGKIYGPLFEALEETLSNPEESKKLSAILEGKQSVDPIVTQEVK